MTLEELERKLQEAAKLRSWEYVVVHHSATKDGVAKDWETIRKWHTGKIGSSDPKSPDYNKYVLNPMRDIGYHLGIERVESAPAIQLGRSFTWDGGHAVGFNHKGFGVCVVGNYDLSPPPPDIWNLLLEAIRKVINVFKIPVEKVIGHRETYILRRVPVEKSCPGKQFDMNRLRSELNARGTSLRS